MISRKLGIVFYLIGLFYYIIFISVNEHTSEAFGDAAGKRFYLFTIYEFGHSFNCGSVRKNEDKSSIAEEPGSCRECDELLFMMKPCV